MKSELNEVIFVLDCSGSMCGLESDTIGGFNAMLKKQKASGQHTLVTTMLFNHEMRRIHDRVALSEVPFMTEEDYCTGGSTALLDAVGESIQHARLMNGDLNDEERPSHTLMVITTDGLENSSRTYSLGMVKELIENRQQHGWEFVFLGANIDAVETAEDMGIKRDCAAEFTASPAGVGAMYSCLAGIRGGASVYESIKERLKACKAQMSAKN